MTTTLYLDTEFTNSRRPHLISLGIVAALPDAREFYAETEFAEHKCTDFVRAEVLPLLDRTPASFVRTAELPARLNAWLAGFERVEVLYDYDWDGLFFLNACGGRLPGHVECRNIGQFVNRELIEAYFAEDPHGRRRHHALHDARALREACR